MVQLSCVIVDDEPKASRLLELMIKELELMIDIKGTFTDPLIALKEIPLLKPDFILLDIDMPELNGFELLSRLENKELHVIFVTGYNHYALDAIKISAVDYLVKPINIEELQEAIVKVSKKVKQSSYSVQNQILLANLQRSNDQHRTIGIPSAQGIDFIPLSDILYLEAIDRYTKVIAENRSELLSSYSIGEFTKLLGSSFIQSHRSYVVNINKVLKYDKDGYIITTNGSSVPIARRRREDFLQMMKDRLP